MKPKPNGVAKANGKAKPPRKIRQLKPAQQLLLRTIQSRIFRYQAEAGEHARLAREALDNANKAALEYNKALSDFAKRRGVDLNVTAWDNEKLEFVEKPPVQPASEASAQAESK